MFRPGTVVITQGDPKSIISWSIRLATGSWWTHGFICLNETEAVEAVFPRVRKIKIAEQLAELKQGNRDYVVMEYPGITDEQRLNVASAAESFVGHIYDLWNCITFVFRHYWIEGGKRLFCSRHMAASYFDGIGVRLFSHVRDKLPFSQRERLQNIEEGYCTPDEIFRYSDLTVVGRYK